MTTTNACTLGNKNSSRVLRPPGGGTSFNIFGVGPEEPKPARGAQRQQQSTAAVLSTTAAASPAVEPVAVATPDAVSTAGVVSSSQNGSGPIHGSVDVVAVNGEADGTVEDDETKKEETDSKVAAASDSTTDVPVVEGSESSAEIKSGNKDELQIDEKEEAKVQEESKTAEAIEDKNKVSPNIKAKAKAATFNPITGEAYDKTAESSVKATTNVRVRQPPGGASTKLW